jgi:hypothetical protein
MLLVCLPLVAGFASNVASLSTYTSLMTSRGTDLLPYSEVVKECA